MAVMISLRARETYALPVRALSLLVIITRSADGHNPFKMGDASDKLANMLKAKAVAVDIDTCQLCSLDENSPDPGLPLNAGKKVPFRYGVDVYCRATRKIRKANLGTEVPSAQT